MRMSLSEQTITVQEVGSGKLVAEDGKTFYLSRFARFSRLPQPGERVTVKLDKREFVRDIVFLNGNKTRAHDDDDEELKAVMQAIREADEHEARMKEQAVPGVRSPELLFRILELAVYHGRNEDPLLTADMFLTWIEERVQG